MPALCTHQEQWVRAEQTARRAGEAGFQMLFPSCLTWQVLKNEELSLELLNLANAKSTLPGTGSYHHLSHTAADEPSAEPGRVRAVARRVSAQKVKVRTSLPCPQSELLGELGSKGTFFCLFFKSARRCTCL